MKKIEILAPVGSRESFYCAIKNGADALYFGMGKFNARNNVEAFSLEDLNQFTKFAHLFNVKIYITLNTLIRDDEIDEVLKLVEDCQKCGVDAFIVQDIGLVYLLRNTFPNIELHASTQMGISSLEAVNFLDNLNFKRVVLARETPLSEIKRIKDNINVDIEYFVQGALCVAYSGNCYLCSLLADSSANRGKCKQFCRLPYSLTSSSVKKDGYLLSTKDFSMLSSLKELVNMGVTSLKIEGRARRPAYIGQAVKIYKNAVDSGFKYITDDIKNLKKVYNRGDYISGYFRDEKIIYPDAQNHIGIEIGKVVKVNNGKRFNEITLLSSYKLNRDDVIKFFINNKEIGIITLKDIKVVGKDKYVVTTTAHIKNDSQVRLVVDNNQEKEILNATRQINVDATLSALIGKKAQLILKTEECEVVQESEFILEESKNCPIDEEMCKIQISKMGDNYKLNNFNCSLENVFIAKSQLNELRRNAIKMLEEKLLENYKLKNKLDDKSKKIDFKPTIYEKNVEKEQLIIFDDFNKVSLNKTDLFVYQPCNFDIKYISNLYLKFSEYKIYISLPVIATKQDIELYKLILEKCPNWGVYANNYYALSLKVPEETIIGSNLNVYNSYAVSYYTNLGYDKIVLTCEDIDLSNIKNCGATLFKLIDFYPEYMYFKHCPIKEHLNGKCDKCKFEEGVTYQLNSTKFNLVRRKSITCQFVLKSRNKILRKLDNNLSSAIEVS